MSTETEEFVTTTVRYAGKRNNSDGKLSHVFYFPDGERGLYKATRGENYTIGAEYEVPATSDKTIRLSQAKFVGVVNDEKRSEWVADDRASQVHSQLAAAEKAAKNTEAESVSNMTLKEAKAFIESGPWVTRTARLAVIMQYLRA